MAKMFFHDNKETEQDFLELGSAVDDLELVDAGVPQYTATPGGPVGSVIARQKAWTVGTSEVGGLDTIS